MSDAELLNWIATLGLSRKCRNLARDFSDAVLMTELIHHFYPKMVDLHNYESALKVDTKMYNWNTLNTKTLKRLGIPIDSSTINGLANSQPGFIQKVLVNFRDVLNGKAPESSRSTKTPKQKKEVPPPPMTPEEVEQYIELIKKSKAQKDLINALEEKYNVLIELMAVADAKIAKAMDKK